MSEKDHMADILSILFSPRIRTKELARLSRRLSTSLAAGVDVRAIWKREANSSGRRAVLRRFAVIHDAVAEGRDMADGIEQCDDFFPELFRQLVRVGEETGTGAEVLARLADHYDAQIKRKQLFLAALTWPIFELVTALLVIAFLICVAPVLKVDILGFGLKGTDGLATYVAFLSGVGIVFLLMLRAYQRRMMWIRPVQRIVLRLPGIGPALETLALSQIAWVLHLTMSTGMDVRRALRLTLSSTNQARYLDQIPLVDDWIDQGGSIHEAFIQAGDYPAEFLDSLQVGEESGRLVESMERLSKQYEGRARLALAALMTILGILIWVLIAVLIIIIIFQIATTSILGPINDLL